MGVFDYFVEAGPRSIQQALKPQHPAFRQRSTSAWRQQPAAPFLPSPKAKRHGPPWPTSPQHAMKAAISTVNILRRAGNRALSGRIADIVHGPRWDSCICCLFLSYLISLSLFPSSLPLSFLSVSFLLPPPSPLSVPLSYSLEDGALARLARSQQEDLEVISLCLLCLGCRNNKNKQTKTRAYNTQ